MDTRTSHGLPFSDRAQAGRRLAARLLELKLAEPITVVALPRGGVPVAAEVARALHAPLDLVLVRKIGMPGQRELAVAAIADGNPPCMVIEPTGTAEAHVPAALRNLAAAASPAFA